MNVFSQFREQLITVLGTLELPEGLSFANVTVEPPRDATHGDLATNVAMVLGKPAGKAPRALADLIAPKLRDLPNVTDVEIAGPGFINIRLETKFWQAQIDAINQSGPDYGRSKTGAGQRVNVEYVSANPTGPMHMGHCRGAVVGDALADLLSFAGYSVTKEYYINDAGSQVDTLARSTHLRYREALGENIGQMPEGFYPGEYLIPVGNSLAQEFGTKYADGPESDWLFKFKKVSVDAMMDLIRSDLATLNIRQSVFSSENALHENGKVDSTFDDLVARDLVYTGALEKPKGDTHEEWEAVPLPLFRSSHYGDDSDRPMKKSDGTWTYFGADVAYHCDKIDRGFDRLINIWGADHAGAVKRLKSAVAALTSNRVPFDIQLVQMVRLFRGGEPVKMSKRSGNFVTLAEVVEEVGRDVVRFMMLTRKSDSQLDFDFEKVREQTKDNPVFYVQYAHARIQSALKKAEMVNRDVPDIIRQAGPDRLQLVKDPHEMSLIRLLCQWPRIVETAAAAHEPHRVTFYLAEVAALLHGLWNKGNDDPGLRFVVAEQPELTGARSALLAAVAQVLRNGLGVMGVEAAQELRSDLPLGD
jgi:arginyl-tRNA synthetase